MPPQMGRPHGKLGDIMGRAQSESGSTRQLKPAVEQQINENLKLLYERQLQEGLPDRLQELVARLRSEGGGQ